MEKWTEEENPDIRRNPAADSPDVFVFRERPGKAKSRRESTAEGGIGRTASVMPATKVRLLSGFRGILIGGALPPWRKGYVDHSRL